jgi:hypothetical protein
VMACTNPSTLWPMTLMGKRDGYSMSDSAREGVGAPGGVVGEFM